MMKIRHSTTRILCSKSNRLVWTNSKTSKLNIRIRKEIESWNAKWSTFMKTIKIVAPKTTILISLEDKQQIKLHFHPIWQKLVRKYFWKTLWKSVITSTKTESAPMLIKWDLLRKSMEIIPNQTKEWIQMYRMEQNRDNLQGEIKIINFKLVLELSKWLVVLCWSEATQINDKWEHMVNRRADLRSELVGFKE